VVPDRGTVARTAATASRHWAAEDFPSLDDQRRAIGPSVLLLLFTWQTPPWLVVILCAAGGAALPIV